MIGIKVKIHRSMYIFKDYLKFPEKSRLLCVSPSDGDFLIGLCRLQLPTTARNRQQEGRDPGTQEVIREEDLGPVGNSKGIPGSTHPDHEERAWA